MGSDKDPPRGTRVRDRVGFGVLVVAIDLVSHTLQMALACTSQSCKSACGALCISLKQTRGTSRSGCGEGAGGGAAGSVAGSSTGARNRTLTSRLSSPSRVFQGSDTSTRCLTARMAQEVDLFPDHDEVTLQVNNVWQVFSPHCLDGALALVLQISKRCLGNSVTVVVPKVCASLVQQQNACIGRRRDGSTKQQESIRSKRVLLNVIRAGSEVRGTNHEIAQ